MKEVIITETNSTAQPMHLVQSYSQLIELGNREKELDYSLDAQSITLDITEEQLEDYIF